MARRSYEQYCSLARTLDVVGERWTLLIVRELMLGPRRFSDLLDGLPGIGRNLLSARLRHMEEQELLGRRQLPPPAGARVYELTEDGRALGPALAALGRWGVERLDTPPAKALFRPGWAVFPLAYMADREAARGIHEVYEFRVGAEVFQLRVDDGAVEPRAGGGLAPDLVLTMAPDTLRDLFSGTLDAVEALTTGRVSFEGAPQVLQNAVGILAGQPPLEGQASEA